MVKKSILLTIISFLVTLLSFANQLVIANYFGANLQMDTYIYASNLPLLISAIITSSLGYSLTPYLIKQKNELGNNYSFFLSALFKKLSLIVIFVYLILIFLSFLLIYKGFIIKNYKIAIIVFLISCIISILNVLQAFFNSIFNSESNFYYPIFLSFLPYLFALIFISFFHQTFGAISISIGLFLGSLFSSILSMIILKKIIIFENFKKSNEFKSIKEFLYKLPAVAISMLCFSIYQTIDSFWATQLGTSNLSYLGYCQRLLIALGALVITGPSTILIPRLTRSIEEGRNEDFLKDISLILKLVIALSSLVAVIGSIIGKEVITLLFQRGAFEIKDSVNVANILPYMLIGMVFMLCVVMLFRAFFTRNFKNEVVMLGLLSTLFYFTFSGIGSNYLGIKGIAISYIITWVLIFIISIHLIFKENSHYILNYNNFLFLIKHLITLFIVSLVVYSTRFIFNEIKYESIFFNNLIITTLIGIIGILTFFIFSLFVFRTDEIILLYKNVFQKKSSLS